MNKPRKPGFAGNKVCVAVFCLASAVCGPIGVHAAQDIDIASGEGQGFTAGYVGRSFAESFHRQEAYGEATRNLAETWRLEKEIRTSATYDGNIFSRANDPKDDMIYTAGLPLTLSRKGTAGFLALFYEINHVRYIENEKLSRVNRKFGTEKSPGTKLFSVSGHIARPGVYELPMGTPIRTLIEDCGDGVPGGRKIKAVFPGGPAFSMVGADQVDLPMDFDSLKKAGTGLGSGGVIVVDDATCMVAQTLKFSDFFKAESCGQCPPCRMGTINLASLMAKVERGEGSQKDLDSLLQLCGFVKGTGYCTLVTGAAVLVQNSVRLFRHEFEEHITRQGCPYHPAAAHA